MAFVELTRDLFENVSISLSPRIHFTSSSAGITGSEYIAPVRSKCIKKVIKHIDNGTTHGQDFGVDWVLDIAKNYFNQGNINPAMETYLTVVGSIMDNDDRFTKKIDIFRFEPSNDITINTSIKNHVRNVLMDYYKYKYDDCGFYYRNYNTLNFFTASNLPENCALIYPDTSTSLVKNYTPLDSFTLQFWINPRYTNSAETQHYHAGTIFHLSSSICVSLISGSLKSSDGLVDSYKILLQLSHSADKKPDKINFNNLTFPDNLIFTSSFELKKDHWHNVAIRWSPSYNNYTGSIIIDNNKTRFYIPSSSVTSQNNKSVVIGNFYDGADSEVPKFFNTATAETDGLTALDAGATDADVKKSTFSNLLNAEIHEIKLYNKYLTDFELKHSGSGLENLDNILFYLPPHFYPETRPRNIIQTPFQNFFTSSNDPFNVAFSFGVGGKEINLENFVREYKQKEYPRLYNMSSSLITSTISNLKVDDYVYSSGSILRRNFLIFPNDNGQFTPKYNVLESHLTGTLTASFANDLGSVDYSLINLESLMPMESLFEGLIHNNGSIMDEIMGASPENPGVAPGAVYTIAQRTRDVSSNEITVYDISNLYYGNRIRPESFELIENNLTGSSGKIKLRIKDNGRGGLYRADCKTKIAKWASIGNVFYDEGIAIIKTPHLFHINKDKTEIKLKGEQNIHSMVISVPCPRSYINSSSNESFVSLPKSDGANDADTESFQITGVNIHDENFNIIMRANFAQPILKDESDEFVVRLKEDF